MRFVFLLLFLISCPVSVWAQINDSSSLAEVEFSQLSQRDPNPLGEKALALHLEQWKHAETDHFIYHFAHSYVATPISVAGRGCLALRRSRVQQRWCGRTA